MSHTRDTGYQTRLNRAIKRYQQVVENVRNPPTNYWKENGQRVLDIENEKMELLRKEGEKYKKIHNNKH